MQKHAIMYYTMDRSAYHTFAMQWDAIVLFYFLVFIWPFLQVYTVYIAAFGQL